MRRCGRGSPSRAPATCAGTRSPPGRRGSPPPCATPGRPARVRPAGEGLASLDGRPGSPRMPPAAPIPAMKRPLLAILTVLLALAPASPASAARLSDDCQDGKIDGTYTQAQFQRALRNLATDVDEYSDCRAVIRRAQLAAAGRRSGGGGGDSDSGGAPGAGSPTTTGGGGAGGATSGSGVTGDPNDTVRDDPLADTTARERHALQEATAGGGTPVAMSG